MTDREIRVGQQVLRTLAAVLSEAKFEPDRVERVAQVLTVIAAAEDEPQEPPKPQVPHRRLRLIHGSLISGLGGMGAAALSVGQRLGGQPVVAVIAAGAVAVAGTATGALYLAGGPDRAPLHAEGRVAARTASVQPAQGRARIATPERPREGVAARVRVSAPRAGASHHPVPAQHTPAVAGLSAAETLLRPVQATVESPAPVAATVSPSQLPPGHLPCLPVPIRLIATVTTPPPVCRPGDR